MADAAFSQRKEKYQKSLSKNIPLLRAKLSLSQTELAELIGSSRQTISLIECGTREMMWDTCLSLTFLFLMNSETRALMPPLGIDIDLISDYLNVSSPEGTPNDAKKDGVDI